MKKLIRLLGDTELGADLRVAVRLGTAAVVLLGFHLAPGVDMAVLSATEAVLKTVRRVAIVLSIDTNR